MIKKILPRGKLNPDDVSGCITFHTYDSALNDIQTNGVTALWNLMTEKRFAYLADEVGMGKTWQAMGIIVLQFLQKPDSKIAVICPGYDLQDKWQKNWKTFIATNYRLFDGTIADSWQRQRSIHAKIHHRLREFAEDLVLNEGKLHILRYSSFSRPIWFGEYIKNEDVNAIKKHYLDCIKNIGFTELDQKEQSTFLQFGDSIEELTRELNGCYSFRVGKLADVRKIDLLIVDEAQYLRHIDNARNTNVRSVFYKKNVGKILFLSATPLHRGEEDVLSLDSYLDEKPIGSIYSNEKSNIVATLEKFMIRRMRTYSDNYKPKRSFSKHLYRNYSPYAIDERDDAYHCLTLGLVQRKLARILKGKNNKFRMGECSSFESLQQSVKRRPTKDVDGVPVQDREFEVDKSSIGKRNKDSTDEKAPDRKFIDNMTRHYRKHVGKYFKTIDKESVQLPHAKIDNMVKILSDKFLKNASDEKALVFVRRLDTVDELMKRLNSMHQEFMNNRINAWLNFIGSSTDITNANEYWKEKRKDDSEIAISLDDDKQGAVDEDQSVQHLPFIAALKRAPVGSGKRNGKLVWFQALLLTKSDSKRKNPLNSLLVSESNNHWVRFCKSLNIAEDQLSKIIEKTEENCPSDFPKIIDLLKRCILQTLRRSEFLVDLDILRRFRRNDELLNNLIQCFEGSLSYKKGVTIKDCEPLWKYISNWKKRLRSWIFHLPLIIDNCFSHATIDNWEECVDSIFYHVSPVAGRSGRLKTEQTIPQFKLPVHPNILICTDVLREGIDLHLFCDHVYHYGIAWSSGDLEQRIGRIDRYSSLISRKIAEFNDTEIDKLPKIEVGFPYLKGTLDSLQVERVRRKKLNTDLTLDFGEQKKDDGKMCAEELYEVLKEKALNLKDGIFEPKGIKDLEAKFDVNSLQQLREADISVKNFGTTLKKIIKDTSHGYWEKNVFHTDNTEYKLKYLPELELFLLLELEFVNVPPNSSICRWRYKKQSGRYSHCRERELLISKEIKNNLGLIIGRFIKREDEISGNGISKFDMPTNFKYSTKLNTAIITIELDNPVTPDKPRQQTVLLEKNNQAYYLKTFVAKSNGEHIKRFAKKAGLPRIKGTDAVIVSINENQLPGWFSIENDNIMYVWKVPCRETVTVSYARNVAIRGDRMQLLMTAADDELENYKSPFSLESHCKYFDIDKIHAWLHTVTLINKGVFMDAAIFDAFRGCGDILHGINIWLDSLVKELQNKLKSRGEIIPEFKPCIEKVNNSEVLKRWLPDAILSKKGKYRMSISLVLCDTNGNSEKYPYIAWQIAGSNQPKTQKLDMYGYDEFPHIAPEDWDVIETDECPESKIYCYRDPEKVAMVCNCHFYTSVEPLLYDKESFFNIILALVNSIQGDSFKAKVYTKKLSKYLVDIPTKIVEEIYT